MSVKSTRKNQTRPPTPPTILVVTLNADGSGSLVAKRGDLAAVRQFTYRDMKDIIGSLQQGAAQLVAVEKDPPPTDLSSASTERTIPPVRTNPPSENEADDAPQVEETLDPDDAADEGDAPAETGSFLSVRPTRANSSSAQMSLL
ncbi:MAG: hypothetical protein IT324_06850 [Anaerolineae bacterium]|nr:hypothetical protein [Anaerolineae bacterium]